LEIDEARQIAARLPPGTVLLCGERHGVQIDGFDLGNSPGDCTEERCRQKTLVLTTTNGTKAILASKNAESVLVASFNNVAATAHAINAELGKRPIHLVCGGTEGEVSLEDTLLAGELVLQAAQSLGEVRDCSDVGRIVRCNDAALIAASVA